MTESRSPSRRTNVSRPPSEGTALDSANWRSTWKVSCDRARFKRAYARLNLARSQLTFHVDLQLAESSAVPSEGGRETFVRRDGDLLSVIRHDEERRTVSGEPEGPCLPHVWPFLVPVCPLNLQRPRVERVDVVRASGVQPRREPDRLTLVRCGTHSFESDCVSGDDTNAHDTEGTMATDYDARAL